jgi:hypothetical protein
MQIGELQRRSTGTSPVSFAEKDRCPQKKPTQENDTPLDSLSRLTNQGLGVLFNWNHPGGTPLTGGLWSVVLGTLFSVWARLTDLSLIIRIPSIGASLYR